MASAADVAFWAETVIDTLGGTYKPQGATVRRAKEREKSNLQAGRDASAPLEEAVFLWQEKVEVTCAYHAALI